MQVYKSSSAKRPSPGVTIGLPRRPPPVWQRRKVICMSGEDIYEALGRRIPIAEVIDRKVRTTEEAGAAFVPLDELFKQ